MQESKPLMKSQLPFASDRKSAKQAASSEIRMAALITIAHIPLGLVLYSVGSAAIIHPILVFVIGMYYAVQKRFALDWASLAAGYIIGAEVLWRMAHVPIYWEFGKYGAAAIMVTALVARRQFRLPKLPLIYFMALLPGCLITILEDGVLRASGPLSFNMSGPGLLLVSCWFFSSVKVSQRQFLRLLFTVSVPIISIACVTVFYTVSNENIQFTTESNFETSGGFGPNQVSSILGLGVFLIIAFLVLFKGGVKLKLAAAAAALLFAAQSVMTFSRGGIYNAAGALLIVLFFQFRNPIDGLKRLFPILVFLTLFVWLVFPSLNNYTGGQLLERFEETDSTHRVDIVITDMQIFVDNPIFGVGVGAAKDYRKMILDYSVASHTEFSRLISEHGAFGVISLLSLVAMTIYNIRRQRTALARSLISGFAVWSILFMFNAGMRLAAPSFLLGMTFITLIEPKHIGKILRPDARRTRRSRLSVRQGTRNAKETGISG